MSVEQFLSDTPLFRGMEEQELAAFAASAHTGTYRRGELLFQAAYSTRVVSFVEHGTVRLYRLTAEGRELTVSILHPGKYFWQISTDAAGVGRSWVEALADETIIHHFSRQSFDALIERYPARATDIIEQISSYLGEAYDRLEDVALRPPWIQLAHTLARLAAGKAQPVVVATHEELANLLGTPRECVTKMLGRLQALGLIICQRQHHILLLDPRRLADL